MNLNQLHYFSRLAETQHYTKAAEELDISQPSLSHAISSLEKELGTRLFEKQGRNVVLTKYGAIFQEYVDESLKVLETGVKKVRSLTGQTEGLVELAYIYTLGSEFVPRIVSDFIRTHEELKVRFHFTVGNTSEVIQGIKEERFDIGFCSMAERESGIQFYSRRHGKTWLWWFRKDILFPMKRRWIWNRRQHIPRFFTRPTADCVRSLTDV